MQSWVVRVNWGPRAETPITCKARIRRHVSELGKLGDVFAEWFLKGDKPIPDRKVDFESDSKLDLLLEAGQQYTDIPRRLMPELGFILDFWNGDAKTCPVTTTMMIGITARQIRNSANVVIRPNDQDVPFEVPWSALKALVEAWEPESGVITRSAYRNERFSDDDVAGYSRSGRDVPRRSHVERYHGGELWRVAS
jgi:hypothetical protein